MSYPYHCEMGTNLYNTKGALIRHYEVVHKKIPTRDMMQAKGDVTEDDDILIDYKDIKASRVWCNTALLLYEKKNKKLLYSILIQIVDGVPRKTVHKGRFDRVHELCFNILTSLEDIAVKRRHNFILDQVASAICEYSHNQYASNVKLLGIFKYSYEPSYHNSLDTNTYASAQRRKIKGFGDFKRIAVVFLPNEDELKRRLAEKKEKDGHVYAMKESTLNNIQANFTLPSLEFGWFDDILYSDSNGEEAKEEVRKINEKGKKAIDSNPANRDKRQRRDNYRNDNRRIWCIAAEILNVRLPVKILLQMICHVSDRSNGYGYHLDTFLLLSVFTGMFGLDRFYLGYYGIGLLKVRTLGGVFISQLVDIILIALQIVRPLDGSYYIVPYYGAVVEVGQSDKKLIVFLRVTGELFILIG
ncbi:hypothetical protein GQX74_011083 [Glossina fuscipes]|nr:hypothetical protein GQX74_011083 [Glossina fuscipes]